MRPPDRQRPDRQREEAERRAEAVTLRHGIGVERKIEALRRPEMYARDVRAVEVRESHMSWVFLTERFAYKMKKPVKWDRLECLTLTLRRTQCENEVVLNRRLAPAVYLGLVRMTCDEKERLCLGGQGEAVEWLVRMVRLPMERKLERLPDSVDPAYAAKWQERALTYLRLAGAYAAGSR